MIYIVRVFRQESGSDTSGISENSSSLRTWSMIKPATISKVSSNSKSQIELTITYKSGTYFYVVYRNSDSTGVFSKIVTIPQSAEKTIYTDSISIVPAMPYYYYVVVQTSDGINSDSSNHVKGIAVLPKPSNFSASKGAYNSLIKLNWDKVSYEVNYWTVYRENSIDSYDSIAKVLPSSVSDKVYYEDTNIILGKKYFYRVKAYNPLVGYSAYSDSSFGYSILDAPDSLKASKDEYSDKIVLEWKHVKSILLTGGYYHIYRQIKDGSAFVKIDSIRIDQGNTSNTYNDNNITRGLPYEYYVTATLTDSDVPETGKSNIVYGYTKLLPPNSP